MLVYVESPYAGNVERNERYARACMADCLKRGEAPFASHLLYTQPGILDDRDEKQRALGMTSGFAWAAKADKSVFYMDLGFTKGMELGLLNAVENRRTVEFRRLGGVWA